MHRILLIDDDAQLGPPLAAYFQRFDLELEQALRPSAGLALLAQGGFDAAILDVMLPEMDGFELCRTIRRDQRHPHHHADRPRRGDGPRGRAWNWAPTTTCPSPSSRANWWPACRPCCAARTRRRPADAPARLEFDGLRIDPARRSVQRLGQPRGADRHRIRPAAPAGARARQGLQPRRHPEPPARPRGRAVHPRGGHRGQPPAQEAGAAGRHQDAAQRRLLAGAAPGAAG